jgi:hypothetical protein
MVKMVDISRTSIILVREIYTPFLYHRIHPATFFWGNFVCITIWLVVTGTMEFYDFSFRGVGRYTTNQPFVGLVSGNLLQFAIENNPFMNFSHELYGFLYVYQVG